MEFLRSFLTENRRHLAGKPVVASPNVGCFLEASKVPKVMISRVKIHLPFAFLVLCNWLGKHERKYYALSFSFHLGVRTAQGK